MVFARLCQCAPHVTSASLGPPESSTETASRLVQPFFSQLTAQCRRAWPVMYFPLKIAPSHGGLEPHLIYMVAWANPTPRPKRHLDRFSRFCRAQYYDRQTGRQTDRPHYSVCNNRPHLRIHSTAMRPTNVNAVSVYRYAI